MQMQIAGPITLLLVVYSYFRKALTPTGILAAVFTAYVAASHPWNLPFTLLCTFFLVGTLATKVKKEYKKTLTLSATGSGGEGPRTHTQVFANSLIATALTWMHTQQLNKRQSVLLGPNADAVEGSLCYSWKGDILPIGIIACYAAAAADTLGSELGILARSEPRLIMDLSRVVPRGTNGGVTLEGLIAGLLGSTIIAFASIYTIPFCEGDASAGALGGGEPWSTEYRTYFIIAIALWGVLGSIFDSWVGANIQRTVKDVRTGKVVEGEGGARAMTTADEEARANREIIAEERRKEIEAKRLAWLARNSEPWGPKATTSGVEQPAELKSREKPEEKVEQKVEEKAEVTKADETKDHSRVVENGKDIFDNNDVNFATSFFMGITALGVACRVFGKGFDSMSIA